MLDVELVSYKISRLNMTNNLSKSGALQLENTTGFHIKYGQGNESAVAVLDICVNHRKNHALFCIDLEIQAEFRLSGIESIETKKMAHIRCYNDTFPYASQIMAYLAVNSGIEGFVLKKFPVQFADVNFGKKPKDSGKVIKLWLDM